MKSLLITSALLATVSGLRIETGYNNTCLYENEMPLNRDGPQEFDCPKFVIDSTDEIWNMYRDDFDTIVMYLDKYMVQDWESISNMGSYVRGFDELVRLVNETLIAFPDMQLHIIDTFCVGNDVDGYKTTMPVIHTATHLGYHPVFGEPTGKKLSWLGIPNCFIKEIDGQWKYTSEVNMPDSMYLYQQLGVEIPPPAFDLSLADCDQLFDWDTGYINPKLVPKPMP